MLLGAHVDEVDHDQAAQVANAHLSRDLFGSFKVSIESGRLDVATLGRARRVDVDGYEGLGVIDDDAAARRQAHRVCKRGFDLALDLETRKQRHRVRVVLQLAQVVRHDLFNELAGLLESLLVVDQDFADVRRQVVAQSSYDGVAFAVDQER